MLTSFMRANSRSKTRGARPCWSSVVSSSDKALGGPHMVYVFPLPVYMKWKFWKSIIRNKSTTRATSCSGKNGKEPAHMRTRNYWTQPGNSPQGAPQQAQKYLPGKPDKKQHYTTQEPSNWHERDTENELSGNKSCLSSVGLSNWIKCEIMTVDGQGISG